MDAKEFFPIPSFVVMVGILAAGAVGAAEKSDSHALRGVVTDSLGNPISGALLAIGHVPSLFEREARDFPRTGTDGTFTLPITYPGDANISIWHPDFRHVTQKVSTESESTIQLQKGAELKGVVAGPNDLPANAVVSVFFPASNYQAYTRANATGRFRFNNLPAGRCHVEARSHGENRARAVVLFAEAVVLPDTPATVRLEVPPAQAQLTGRVEYPSTTNPAATLALHINRKDGIYKATTRADKDDGSFAFQNLPAGEAQLVVSAPGCASQLRAIDRLRADTTLPPVVLQKGAPLRCSFLNIPESTQRIHFSVYYGKRDRPDNVLADVRALLDAPTAWSGALRDRAIEIDNLAPGTYTLLAYPVDVEDGNLSTFEQAEILRFAPVYMDRVSIAENTDRTTLVAASFPGDKRPDYAASQQPRHPIIGRWIYRHEDVTWSRIFTPDGYCQLMEGPLPGWRARYVILSETKVAVLFGGRRRMHTIREDGKLDIVGKFVGTKVR